MAAPTPAPIPPSVSPPTSAVPPGPGQPKQSSAFSPMNTPARAPASNPTFANEPVMRRRSVTSRTRASGTVSSFPSTSTLSDVAERSVSFPVTLRPVSSVIETVLPRFSVPPSSANDPAVVCAPAALEKPPSTQQHAIVNAVIFCRVILAPHRKARSVAGAAQAVGRRCAGRTSTSATERGRGESRLDLVKRDLVVATVVCGLRDSRRFAARRLMQRLFVAGLQLALQLEDLEDRCVEHLLADLTRAQQFRSRA